jgi:hypothetical protein
MALPAGTMQTHQAIGNREDLTDLISTISPTETPFYSMVPRVKARMTKHEHQTDSLAAPASNRHLEGDDSAVNTAVPTTRVFNFTQIFKKTIQVSGTQEVVDKAGRDSEIAYQLMKRGKEIKRDIEMALTQNQAGTGGATATVRSLGSVESWLSSNWTSKGSGSPVHTGFDGTIVNSPVDATTTGSFSEANLKAMIKECWSSGGNPTVVMCGPTAKQKISSFAGIGTQFRDVGGKTAATNRIVGAADIYISDFGEHRIVPNRFQRDRTVLILDMDYWAVAVLRGMTKEKLAKTGDSDKWHLLTELTLESRNEKASAKIADVDGTL